MEFNERDKRGLAIEKGNMAYLEKVWMGEEPWDITKTAKVIYPGSNGYSLYDQNGFKEYLCFGHSIALTYHEAKDVISRLNILATQNKYIAKALRSLANQIACAFGPEFNN